jgi:hypothetical protein
MLALAQSSRLIARSLGAISEVSELLMKFFFAQMILSTT